MSDTSFRGWHYLPIIANDGDNGNATDSPWYSIIEVFLNDDGKLEYWDSSPRQAPGGETIEELENDLANMLHDLRHWEPVEYSSLTAGMEFKPKHN